MSTDADLVVAARRGDPEALGLLWRRHRKWVGSVILAHGPRQADAQDLLQEVALVVVRKIRTLGDPGAFRPWLRTIAVNTARAAARQPQGGESSSLEIADPRVERDLARARARVEMNRVLEALAELPVKYREPLMLRSFGGLGQRAIAESMAVPETTVETRLARARRMLRDRLAHEDRQMNQRRGVQR